ncbi:MAG: LPS export ABC transporter permease LptG [Aquincola sp.]|nr:LPS export ABC transporter permease LptG [Aquincola sp.]MDH4290329.1 LPS export ABC transporter permease LptG [Aquincola sp.]MDH5329051.1 LPS export ABC transporter permease LptG [Aquincola sp.]
MKTVRRLLYRAIVGAVAFVTIAFLSLFFFIDFVDELQDVGKGGFTLMHAVLSSLLDMPGHFYELFPITVLIGTIFALARMAQTSEFTILRTGGLGPGRALGLLTLLAAGFAVVSFLVGDYVAPWSEREGVLLKAGVQGGRQLGRTGAWLKDRRTTVDGRELNVSVNVRRTTPDGVLEEVRIFEVDVDSRLVARVAARTARIGKGYWLLDDVRVTEWPSVGPAATAASAPVAVLERHLDQARWPTSLDAGVVAAAVLPVSTMTTIDLWRYSRHLANQEQAAQRHSIQFWKKALYPLACIVMVALALPFAYLQARRGGISAMVFGGIMLGISFVLLNNVAGHLGVLRDWTPWVVAAAPSVLYLLLSMAAFAWLVRYR